MSRIQGAISSKTKQRIIPATVLDVVGSRCSVQLSDSGSRLKGLVYYGPKPLAGDKVSVDYSNGTPIVVCPPTQASTPISVTSENTVDESVSLDAPVVTPESEPVEMHDWRYVDENNVVRIVISALGSDIEDEFGVPANILGRDPDGNNKFWLDSDTGLVHGVDGFFDGTITAHDGTIGGFDITDDYLIHDTGVGATSAGMAPSDYPFYAGAIYANRASAPFRVTPSGILTASGAVISGAITATSGAIAGFTIAAARISSTHLFLDNTGEYLSLGATPPTSYGANVGVFVEGANNGRLSLYKDANNYFQWDSSKLLVKAANFTLDASGNITATSVTLTGSITATSGAISGFSIAAARISSTHLFLDNTGEYLSLGTTPPTSYGNNVGVFIEGANSGRLSIYKDTNNYFQWDSSKLLIKAANFTLDASGNITASSATISGAITATSGTIGSFTIGTYLYTGSKTAYNDANSGVHLGSDGIGIGNNVFTVSSAGALVATSATITGAITATSGAIGGWTIGAATISSGSLTLNSTTPSILIGAATDYLTGIGIFLGKSSGSYKAHFGNPSGNYLSWDATNLVASGQWIKGAGLDPSLQTWTDNVVFTSASDTQINWTSGTLRLNDGTTYAISSGNTGTMAALTYIYFDSAVSTTAYQVTTTYSTAVGTGKILIAAGQNASGGASVLPFDGQQAIINGGTQITALSILAGNIAAGAVTASKISVTSLSAITATMGSLTVDSTLTMNGASGAIAIGTTPPSSATVGTGLWVDRTGVYSLSANVQNATLTSAGLSAGAGAVSLDTNGINIDVPNSLADPNTIKFKKSGVAEATLSVYDDGATGASSSWQLDTSASGTNASYGSQNAVAVKAKSGYNASLLLHAKRDSGKTTQIMLQSHGTSQSTITINNASVDVDTIINGLGFSLLTADAGLSLVTMYQATVTYDFSVGGNVTITGTLGVTGVLTASGGISALSVSETSPWRYTDYGGVWEFFAAGAHGGWTVAAISTGTITLLGAIANHHGAVQISNNSAANAGYEFDFGIPTSILLAGGETFEFVFRIDNTGSTNVHRYGFMDLYSTALPVDGAWIHIAGATLDGRTSNNSTRSTTATNYTVSSTWYRIKIVINTTSLVTYTLYSEAGAVLWTDTLTTNIPSVAGRETSLGLVAYRTTATAGVNLATWDWVWVHNETVIAR